MPSSPDPDTKLPIILTKKPMKNVTPNTVIHMVPDQKPK